ncbi:MAG: type II toxin-antitoxin system Phd/YefM family antitoxin [Synechococcus sp.]
MSGLVAMDLVTVREARENLQHLIDEVSEHHKQIIISGQNNSALLISKEDWNAIQRTIYMSGILEPDPAPTPPVQPESAEKPVRLEDLNWF